MENKGDPIPCSLIHVISSVLLRVRESHCVLTFTKFMHVLSGSPSSVSDV